VTPAEARSLTPLRLRIVAAQAGDTAEDFAARMAVDRGFERFLVLNGLDRGGPLVAGERYKLVVE
jgi:predicted Zn-dependent protease